MANFRLLTGKKALARGCAAYFSLKRCRHAYQVVVFSYIKTDT